MKAPRILAALVTLSFFASYANLNRFDLRLDRNYSTRPLSFSESEIWHNRSVRGWPIASFASGGGSMLAKLYLVGPLRDEDSWAIEPAKLPKWFTLITAFNLVVGLFLGWSLFVASKRLLVRCAGRPAFSIASLLAFTGFAAVVFSLRQDLPVIAYLSGASHLCHDPGLALYYASLAFLSLAIISIFANTLHWTMRLPLFRAEAQKRD